MDIEAVDHIPGSQWLEFRFRDGPRVLVKFDDDGQGRAVMTRLLVAGSSLNSQVFRALPLGRLEAIVNVLRQAPDTLTELGPLSGLTQRKALFPKKFRAVESRLEEYLEQSVEYTQDAVKASYQDAVEASLGTTGEPREPLSRPDGTDPEAFAKQVARAYNEAIVTSPSPAKLLAEEAGVPVTTVHRWIREARRRGALPPARKGRAG